jgi:nitrate reductase gamma subunit
MDSTAISGILALTGVGIGLLGILLRINEIMRRPFKADLSRPRGNVRRGVLYAFTLGMAPWEKESTRRHWFAYIRGILFHVGVFTAIAAFLASPWLARLPQWLVWLGGGITAIGAVFGYAGILVRLTGENERVLSLPDDYFSVFLTATFTALAAVVLLTGSGLTPFYLVTAVLGIYVPVSKIRHCVYFFYSKFFFGAGFGRRGVIGQPKGRFSE